MCKSSAFIYKFGFSCPGAGNYIPCTSAILIGCAQTMRLPKLTLFLMMITCSVRSTGQHSFIKLPDTLNKSAKYYSPTFRPICKPLFRGILTIGQPLDSLDLEPYYKIQPPYKLEDTIKKLYSKNDGLSIVFDTLQEADCAEYVFFSKKNKKYYPANRITFYENGQLKSINASASSQIEFKGTPVCIINLTNEEITVKHPKYRLELVQEALDKNNEWKQIETIFKTPKSTTSYMTVHTLKPGQFILTAIYKYKGDFKTQLRLKLISDNKIYYSQPFSGTINYSQITSTKDFELN